VIWYRDKKENDPYIDLWRRRDWLYPFENSERRLFPLIITVEPTNICQNNCLYCCRRLMKRKLGYLSFETMEKVAEEAAKHKSAIRHGGFGEPLIHPQIIDIVAITGRHDVLTTIFTNGQYLTEDMMSSFIENGLNEIRFSSSGISPSEHNDIRLYSDFDRDFDEKIMMAYRIKKEMRSEKPFLTAFTHVLDYKSNEFKNNVKAYKDKYLQYCDKVDIDLTMYSRVKHLGNAIELHKKQNIKEKHEACVTLFLKNIVYWNGDVFACDLAYNFEESHYLGNILNDNFSIEEAYNSSKIKKLRQNLCFNLYHNQYELCENCYSNTTKWEDKEWWLNKA